MIDMDATWWCVDIVGSWAHVERQLKHWVDGKPVIWDEDTREIAPGVHHAYQFGHTYYVCAEDREKALAKVRRATND